MGLNAVEVNIQDLPVTPTLVWNGTHLFGVGDGIKLLDYCKDNGIAILGIEGFNIKGCKRVPDMDCIVDFSASLNEVDFVAKSIGASRVVIDGMAGSDVMMEFLLVRA